jgi:UDP-N-acetylmuramate--alanine ligase
MHLKKFKYIYFIGIGGIGMSALVEYFILEKKTIIGYDIKYSHTTEKLEKKNVNIIYEDNTKLIPKKINKYNTIIIYSSAINKNNKIFNFFIINNFCCKKRSEILGIITKNTYCIAIAGTHGKTTTSAILTHILHEAKVKITSFIGGIAKNYNSNFLTSGKNISIVEADEFDKSFLYLYPNMICITSLDLDHVEIYQNTRQLKKYYKKFINLLPSSGILFIKKELKNLSKGFTYSIKNKAYAYSENLKLNNKNIWVFDYYFNNIKYTNIPLPILGNHNLENTIAAISIAMQMNIQINVIKNALISFKGIERRMDIKFMSNKYIYIDDYAHHPTEIKNIIETLKNFYFKKNILGIFQPHLYSRTKKFINEFAEILNQLHYIILLNIYAAREKYTNLVSSTILLNKIKNKNKNICHDTKNIIDVIKNIKFDAILTIGAGDINDTIDKNKLIKYLNERSNM